MIHCWLATLISSPKSALFLPNAGAVSQAVALRGHAVKPVNDCAQCGADIIAPESEHLSDRRVWSCADCGYQFEDVVYLSARELIEDD
jgi:DNA-directed RNA polymerase subunit RPC12/RpoP